MLSVIIPAYNQHDMTHECLTAVRQYTQDCEIILIDNGSTPAYQKPYTGFVPCTLIRNETNLGYPAAVNQGIAAATGDIIILLNNDVAVTPRWAERLMAPLLDADLQFAIVGATTNFAAGKQCVQIGGYDSEQELADRAEEWAEHWQDHVDEVKWIIGVCMAFPRALWKELGPLDEGLWPSSGEDLDFCLRARAAGHRVGIVTGCYVHHEGGVTFRELMSVNEYNAFCEKTSGRIQEKWGRDAVRQAIDANPRPQGTSINLGCGYRRLKGFVNLDNRAECNPDLLCDITAGLPFEDSSVDLVRADDFLEHIPSDRVIAVMNDIWRVLKPDGVLDAFVPSTDGRGAFQDPTHRSFWNRNSWLYYSDPSHRALYGIKANFTIDALTENEPGPDAIIHTHVLVRARKDGQ